MSSMTYKVLSVLVVVSLLLTACAPSSSAAPSNGSEPSVSVPVCETTNVVFADEQLELLYQAFLQNNPQFTGCDQEKRQYFFFRYGGESAQVVYAKAYAQEKGNIVFLEASSVLTLGSPPAWLAALVILTGTTTILAMDAQVAANLNLPTISIEQVSDDMQMIVSVASVTASYIAAEAQASAAADAYLQSVLAEWQATHAEAKLESGKIFDERMGPITWVVSSSMLNCMVNLQVWDVNRNKTYQLDEKGSGYCSPEFIKELIAKIIRQGIEAGIDLGVMNSIGQFIFESIAKKFGW